MPHLSRFSLAFVARAALVALLLVPPVAGARSDPQPLGYDRIQSLTTLDIIERPGFLDRVGEVGARFEESFVGLPFEVRRRGMFMGLKFPVEGDAMLAARDLIGAGVFAVFANNDTSVLQFLPPLTVSDREVDEICTIVRSTFS